MNKRKSIIDNIVFFLTAFFIASFSILHAYSYGKYIMLAIAILILLLGAYSNDGKVYLCFDEYQKYILLFAVFCLLSAFWATKDANLAISKGTTLISILFTFYPLYLYYKNQNAECIFRAIMWSGFLVTGYVFAYFGVSTIVSLAFSAQRLPSIFDNTNTIGMLVAVATIISFYFFLNEGLSITTFLMVPAVVIVAVSGSRKAFVMLLAGVAMVYALHYLRKGNIKAVLGLVLGGLIGIVILIVAKDMPLFAMILQRMEGLIGLLTGNGVIDNSSRVRNLYSELGINLFLEHPIVGIGMDNAKVYNGMFYGEEHYLHNNYVELLANGGIIGFVIYYALYFKILVDLWKAKASKDCLLEVVFTLVVLNLIMQYGYVAYYDKINYIYLMGYCLYIEKIKERRQKI